MNFIKHDLLAPGCFWVLLWQAVGSKIQSYIFLFNSMKKCSIQKENNIQFKKNKFVQFNEIKYVLNSMIFLPSIIFFRSTIFFVQQLFSFNENFLFNEIFSFNENFSFNELFSYSMYLTAFFLTSGYSCQNGRSFIYDS